MAPLHHQDQAGQAHPFLSQGEEHCRHLVLQPADYRHCIKKGKLRVKVNIRIKCKLLQPSVRLTPATIMYSSITAHPTHDALVSVWLDCDECSPCVALEVAYLAIISCNLHMQCKFQDILRIYTNFTWDCGVFMMTRVGPGGCNRIMAVKRRNKVKLL